jgi:hypothetical protein
MRLPSFAHYTVLVDAGSRGARPRAGATRTGGRSSPLRSDMGSRDQHPHGPHQGIGRGSQCLQRHSAAYEAVVGSEGWGDRVVARYVELNCVQYKLRTQMNSLL